MSAIYQLQGLVKAGKRLVLRLTVTGLGIILFVFFFNFNLRLYQQRKRCQFDVISCTRFP